MDVGDNMVLLRASVRSTNGGAAIALAALDGSMDGSIATNQPANSDIYVDNYQRMTLVYDPPKKHNYTDIPSGQFIQSLSGHGLCG